MHFGEMGIVHAFSCIHGSGIEQVFYFVELAIVDVDVVDESASIGIGLDINASFAITAIRAVFYEYILYTSRHFTT